MGGGTPPFSGDAVGGDSANGPPGGTWPGLSVLEAPEPCPLASGAAHSGPRAPPPQLGSQASARPVALSPLRGWRGPETLRSRSWLRSIALEPDVETARTASEQRESRRKEGHHCQETGFGGQPVT